MASFLHSRKDITQGDPLDMVAYSIVVIPLINNMKFAHPDVTQPWYADNFSALGMFDNIGLYFN